MIALRNDMEYRAVMKRIEELLSQTDDDTPADDYRMIELDLLSEAAEKYEQEHFPIKPLSLQETLNLRIAELGLSQKSAAQMVGISTSRMNEILSGKRLPTYLQAQSICRNMSIDAAIVLGVA